MTQTGYTLNMSAVAESEDRSLTLNWFQEASFTIGLASIFGACLCDPATEKPRYTHCMACLESEELIINSKIHSFGFAGADNVLEAGNHIDTAQIGEMNIGAAICYDLRLPELSSTMANQCDAIIIIAN